MQKPSKHWKGFDGMTSSSDKYKQISHLLSSANFDFLVKRAIESRKKCEEFLPSHTECSINLTHFAFGYDNLVLELTFSDDVCWIARIPYKYFDDMAKTSMLSEIATMKIVQEQTSIPIPRIFDFEATSDQPFKYPFILMSYLGGCTLPNGLTLTDDIPQQYHAHIARQLASVFAELQNLTFSRIGRLWAGEKMDEPLKVIPMPWHPSPGPLETSLEFFYKRRYEEDREIAASHPDDPDWRTAIWILRTSLAHVPVNDRIRGPFPLCHLDLHSGNMLFDDEYNLTAIIDWSSAQAAPLEQLSIFLAFNVFPDASIEEKGFMSSLKKSVVEHLAKLEQDQKQKPLLDDPAGKDPTPILTTLSMYWNSVGAEVAHRQYMNSPVESLWVGKYLAEFIYGASVSWEQLKEVYGTMPLQ